MRGNTFPVFIGAALILIVGVGCRTPGTSATTETEKATAGCSIVLFRFSSNSTPIEKFNSKFAFESWPLTDSQGRFDNSEGTHVPIKHVNSKTRAGTAWYYITLAPGSSCIRLLAKGNKIGIVPDAHRELPIFYLNVERGPHIIYAGSFEFGVASNTEPKQKVKNFTLSRINSEYEEAKSVAAECFPTSGACGLARLVSYDNPRAELKRRQAEANLTISGQVGPSLATDASIDKVGSAVLTPGIAVLSGMRYMGTGGDGRAVLLAGGVGVGLLIVAAPIALTSSAIHSHSFKKKWKEYGETLQHEVTDFHFEERLPAAIKSKLGTSPMDSTNTSAIHLTLRPYSIFLREVESHKFALTYSLQVQLFDNASDVPIWGHNFVYASAGLPPDEVSVRDTPVGFRIKPGGTLHSLDDFKGEAGAKLFRDELERINEALANEIAFRLRGS